MGAIAFTPRGPDAKNAPTSGRLFFLDLSAGRILSAYPDGSHLKTIINEGRRLPDGLVLDVAAGHIYSTNMGDPTRKDGSIKRSELNGKNMITIVPPGGTFSAIKERVNAVAFAPAEDYRHDSALFLKCVGDPEAQNRIKTAVKRGFHTR